MSFDSLFDYSTSFSQAGVSQVGKLNDSLFAGTDKNKTLRETSPEASLMMSSLGSFLESGKTASQEQKKSAADSAGRMNNAKEDAQEGAKDFDSISKNQKKNPYPDNQNKRK